ncbi:MAG: outer membrane beta-barrel protein [Flavobacteriales bacterium]
MKKIVHQILVTMTLCCMFQHTHAQQRRAPSLNFGLQIAQPLGQFGTVYDGYPAGLAGTFSGPIGRSPFEIGIGGAWNSMGSQSEDVSAFAGVDADGDSIYEQGTMRIRSNMNRFQVLARFRPFNGMIQPYGDLVMGAETFKTKTDITLDNNGYTEANNDVRQHFAMTYSYGWAAGLRIRIADNIFIDGRFESLTGGMVSFVDQESIQVIDESNITFDLNESRTDKYTFQLGLAIGF